MLVLYGLVWFPRDGMEKWGYLWNVKYKGAFSYFISMLLGGSSETWIMECSDVFKEGWVFGMWMLMEYLNKMVIPKGGHISFFFLNVNVDFKCFSWTKNELVLKWFLGNFKCFKLMFLFLRGVSKINRLKLKVFLGGAKNSLFSKVANF